jgi:hypothetical protein
MAIMIPLPMPDKKIAMAGAFVNRFSIGFVIGAVTLPLAPWLSGLIAGVLLRLPDSTSPDHGSPP